MFGILVIPIDEYDVPLDKANFYGYYDEMVSLIRRADTATAGKEIKALIAGVTVWEEIHKELVYRELPRTLDNILFITGYLTYGV